MIRRLHGVGRVHRDRTSRIALRGLIPCASEHREDGEALVGNASKVDVILLAKRAGI